MKHNKHLRHEAATAAPSVTPSPDEIARKAYDIYLNQGCPQGRDVQHWLEAEAQTIATSATSAGAS